MDLRLSDLLSTTTRPDLTALLAGAPPLPPGVRHLLISGPPRSGKTSLLFHLAYSQALKGRSVLLLCQRSKLEQTPPLLPEGVPHSSGAWDRVQIKYLESGQELLRYAASMHLLPGAPPQVLLVDDLHALSELPAPDDGRPRPRDMGLCRILALLHDTVSYLEQRTGQPCMLAVAEQGGSEGPRVYLTHRWLPLALGCRPVGGSFRLAVVAQPRGSPLAPLPTLEYSLRGHSCLVLENVHPPASPPPGGSGGAWH